MQTLLFFAPFQASQLRAENEELAELADKLKAQVYSLKQELRWHINNGCKVRLGAQCLVRFSNTCQNTCKEHYG